MAEGTNRADRSDALPAQLGELYVIERELSGGGMSRVFVAEDAALGRKVVIKVLSAELAEGLSVERFKREVRLAARLQHPHIVPLLAAGALDTGTLYYTMPYVEGESLRVALEQGGALPVTQVVRVLCDVASALAYAHRAGVVHRDIKPENILLGDGGAVVADFGIAKAISASRDGDGGGNPRRSSTLTVAGTSLGTPAYMAPEQIAGDHVDARADLYALGVVAYEMLAGEPPFRGRSAQQVMAAHATQEPEPLERRRSRVPPSLSIIVRRLLQKNPADRLQSAEEVLRDLAVVDSSGPSAPSRASWRTAIPWVIAAAATASALLIRARSVAPALVTRFELALPDSVRLRVTAAGQTIALSPDGTRLVYTGGPEASGRLFVRNLDDLESRPIPGTDRAQSPVFSPDGERLLFLVDGRLRRVDLSGGAPTTVSDSGAAAAWDDEGILFAHRGNLYRISADGGAPRLVAAPGDGILSYSRPSPLPGGKSVLVTFRPSRSTSAGQIGVVDLADGHLTDLKVQGVEPRYLPTGHLIFGSRDGRVFGMAFDPKRRRLSGPIVPLIDDVIVNNGGATQLTVARNGTMAYRSGRFLRRVVLVDRRGAATPLIDEPREYAFSQLSPDGKRLAVTIGMSTATSETWIFTPQTGALTQLTHGGGERPEWTPDGTNVVVVRQDTSAHLVMQRGDGADVATDFITTRRGILEVSMPRTPRGFFAVRIGGGGQRDIWIAPLDSPAAIRRFVATDADEFSPAVSPDGRWLAYVSNQSGRYEVYVRSMSGSGGATQISTNGAVEPLWSPTGRELFYRADRKLIAARISWTSGVPQVAREALFDDVYAGNGNAHVTYSVMPDGNHFVFLQSAGGEPKTIVVLNWFDDVRRRMSSAAGPERRP